MDGKSLLMIALMLGLIVAGCLGGSDDPVAQDDGSSATGGNETMPADDSFEEPENETAPEPEPASPPTANLTADIGNGSAPLTVNFTIDASDPDGDLASWTLEFDDGNETDGTEFPAVVNHTYERAGNMTVNLTVVDAAGRNTTADLVIVVEERFEPFEETVGLELPCPQCTEVGSLTCVGRQADMGGIDCQWIDYPDEMIGRTFIATSTGGDPELYFFEDCSGSSAVEGAKNVGEESGTIPESAGCVLAWEYETPGSSITFRIE